MRIEDLWRELSNAGLPVPADVQRSIGLRFNQERVLVRPPASNNKELVLQAGTSVPATYVARQLGITVRMVRKYRTLLQP